MRFPLGALAPVVVVLAGSSCASGNHRPATLYGLDLTRPHDFEQPTGAAVPCGKGMAWLFRDLLWSCAIDRPTNIRGNDLPAGATLWFRGDGTLEQVAYVEGEGRPCDGEDRRVRRVVKFDDWGEEIVSSTVEPSRRD